jgi:hypothetical protein
MLRWIVMGLVLAVAWSMPAAAADPVETQTWTIGAYRVVVQKTEPEDSLPTTVLTVSRDGTEIYRQSNALLFVNPTKFFRRLPRGASYDDEMKPYRVGQDVLRLGAPALVVQGFTFGADCCFDLTVLVLGPRFHATPTWPLVRTEMADIRPAKGRRGMTISLDEGFGFAGAHVVLSYDRQAGQYVADAKLMAAPLPPAEDLRQRAATAKTAHQAEVAEQTGRLPSELSQPVFDLIYTGHLREAKDFARAAWGDSPDAFLRYWSYLTICQLRTSPFWPTVAKMNDLPAAAALCDPAAAP